RRLLVPRPIPRHRLRVDVRGHERCAQRQSPRTSSVRGLSSFSCSHSASCCQPQRRRGSPVRISLARPGIARVTCRERSPRTRNDNHPRHHLPHGVIVPYLEPLVAVPPSEPSPPVGPAEKLAVVPLVIHIVDTPV